MRELDQGYKAPNTRTRLNATTYKRTRIAPFYSNMQKEQTTSDHILLIK